MSEQLIQQLVNGLLIGFLYSLIAIGLTMIWGVMNIINFAHGDFLMLSMFISFWLYTLYGLDPIFSIPICTGLLFLLGLLIYKYLVSKVMTGPALAQLVVTFGVSIFIANAAVLLWTPDFKMIEKPLLTGRGASARSSCPYRRRWPPPAACWCRWPSSSFCGRARRERRSWPRR